MGIRGRLTAWFVLGGMGILLIGAYAVYATGLSSIQGTLGQTFCQIASGAAEQFENQYFQKNALIDDIATDVLTADVIAEVSSIYRKRPPDWIDARLKRLDREWKALSSEGRRRALHRELSQRIQIFARLDAEVIREISVYDSVGVLVAASDPQASRIANTQRWFKLAKTATRHFTLLDTGQRQDVLIVVVPVWLGVDIAGYVTAEISLAALSAHGEKVRFGKSGEARVVDYAGVPLAGRSQPYLIAAMSKKNPANVVSQSRDDGGQSPYWVAISGAGSLGLDERLACIAPLNRINALREAFQLPPWLVVVTQSPVESYFALRRSLGFFGIAGILGLLILGVVAAIAAHNLAKPLENLRAGVRRFAQGERDQLVAVSSADEIGELAKEFNRMAQRVAHSENELKAFAQAVEDAADAIIITDAKRKIYYANPSFERVTGYSAQEVRGSSPSLLSTSKTSVESFSALNEAINTGKPWRGELWNERKNGEVYPVDLTISPIHDETGKIVSYLGIHRDITLWRQYEESLEKKVEERTREISRTRGLTQLGRMASMIAHDLRNALSTIKMNLQILSRRHEKDTGGTEREHCQMALDQVGYMEGFLNDMLTFARPGQIRADWSDVGDIIDDTVAATRHLAEENNIKIVCQDSRTLPKIYCDRFKIVAVLRNLIENAIMAMPDGGDLLIAARLVMNSPHPLVSITITDNGVGIADDLIEEVMEPFFTTRTKGTGLGLAIVKRIVEGHRGEVHLRSQPGQGTSVEIILPTVPEGWEKPDAGLPVSVSKG